MVYENKIMVVRMVTGEDVIAKVKKGPEVYTLDDPMKIVYSVSLKKAGVLDMFLMRWCFTKVSENQKFTIDRSHILFAEDASKEIKEVYLDTLSKHYKDDDQLEFDNISDVRKILQEHIKKDFE